MNDLAYIMGKMEKTSFPSPSLTECIFSQPGEYPIVPMEQIGSHWSFYVVK